MKMLIVSILHHKVILVLLIIKIPMLIIIRNHDLVLLALYMRLNCHFKTNNDIINFDMKLVCFKTFQNVLKYF